MNPYAKIHDEARAYRLSRIKDAIEGNREREQYFVSGGYIHPHTEPQGSFTRPTGYASNLAYTDETLQGQGSMRTAEGQAWKQRKNAERAKQLAEKQAMAEGLPAPTDVSTNVSEDADKAKTALELFFNSVVDTDFSNMVGSDKEMKQAIGNLQKYGTSLSQQDLKRYVSILEESVESNITNIKDVVEKIRAEQGDPNKFVLLLKEYETNVENIEELELMYKMFLMLKGLESTIDMDPKSRQVAFTQQFKEIIKARPRKIMPTNLFNAYEEAKNGMKELKDALPSANFDVRKARKTAEATAKVDDDKSDDDDSDDDGDDDYEEYPLPSYNDGSAYFEPQFQPAYTPAKESETRPTSLPYPMPRITTNVADMRPMALPPLRQTVDTAYNPADDEGRIVSMPSRVRGRRAPSRARSRAPSRAPARPVVMATERRSNRNRKAVKRYNPSTGKGKKVDNIKSIIQKMKSRK